MSKALGITFITLCLSLFLLTMWALISNLNRDTQTQKQWIKEKLITIEVDGKEYLFGEFNKNVVIIPKTPKCSCDKFSSDTIK